MGLPVVGLSAIMVSGQVWAPRNWRVLCSRLLEEDIVAMLVDCFDVL